MSSFGDKGSAARSPEEVLRQARIAHSNRVASLAQVNNVVNKQIRQRRASLVRLQFDKERPPFSPLDAAALAAGWTDDNGDANFEEVLASVLGEEAAPRPYGQHEVNPTGTPATSSKPLGSSGSSSLCSPSGTATEYAYSAYGSSCGVRLGDNSDREGRTSPESDAGPNVRAGYTVMAMGPGGSDRPVEMPSTAAPAVPRVAPTIAWGESTGGGALIAFCRTPDPTGPVLDPGPSTGWSVTQAPATTALGSTLPARVGSPSLSAAPTNPPWIRNPRSSAPSGALVPSRGGFAGSIDGTEQASVPSFRPVLISASGAGVTHCSPLPQLPSNSPKQQPSHPLELSPPQSPRLAAPSPPSLPQHGAKGSQFGPAAPTPALIPTGVPPASPPAHRPPSQHCRTTDRPAPVGPQATLMLPSIGASPQPPALVVLVSSSAPASPASRLSPGSSGTTPSGTGAWRLAAPVQRDHGRNLAAPVATSTDGRPPKAAALVAPSSASATGLSDPMGASRPESRRGSAMGTLDSLPYECESLTVMRSGVGFSARRRGPSGTISGRHTPLLRPTSRGVTGSPALCAPPASCVLAGSGNSFTQQQQQQDGRNADGPLTVLESPGSISLPSGPVLAGPRQGVRFAQHDGGEARRDGEASVRKEARPQRTGLDVQTVAGAGVTAAHAAGCCPAPASPRGPALGTASAAAVPYDGDGDGLVFSAPLPAPLQPPSGLRVGCLFQADHVGRRRRVSESSGHWAQPAQAGASAVPMRSLHMGAAPDGVPLVLPAPV